LVFQAVDCFQSYIFKSGINANRWVFRAKPGRYLSSKQSQPQGNLIFVKSGNLTRLAEPFPANEQISPFDSSTIQELRIALNWPAS